MDSELSPTTTIESPPCPGCGVQLLVDVSLEQARELLEPEGRLIQQIFPHWSPSLRERFITGYCQPCWDTDIAEPEDKDLHADSGDYGVDDG